MNDIKTPATPELRIPAEALHAYVRAIWERAGSAPREAELVADHLVMANLSGHDSHGVGMIPRYVASLADGELKLNAHAKIVRDAGAVLSIDGVKGFGQVVAYEAMEHGIERAKKLGVCAVGLRDAHHIGRIGHWAEQCAKAGLVSFHFVNVAGDPLVAPFGGIDRRFGTNPFCAAFPRDGKTAARARLRDERHRVRQDARRVQQGREGRAGLSDRTRRHADRRAEGHARGAVRLAAAVRPAQGIWSRRHVRDFRRRAVGRLTRRAKARCRRRTRSSTA